MAPPAVHMTFGSGRSGARVARVTIDHAAKLNCLSSQLIVELRHAFDRLGADANLRAVVLTGAGERAFIGGADIDELSGLTSDSARLFITRLHQACRAIRDCPVPVIARINGFCLGAGLEVALSCDMRAAAEDAQLGMPEVRLGLPSVIEAALLPGQIGWGRTRELLLTGVRYAGAEALAMGLVEKVAAADALDQAIEPWLEGIASATQGAVRAQKRLINAWERVSIEEGVLLGIDALADAYATGEPQAALGAFRAAKKTR
jgi:enoyl-CoA hydratase/carnithine racemase